ARASTLGDGTSETPGARPANRTVAVVSGEAGGPGCSTTAAEDAHASGTDQQANDDQDDARDDPSANDGEDSGDDQDRRDDPQDRGAGTCGGQKHSEQEHA